jgi:hypothetical protein
MQGEPSVPKPVLQALVLAEHVYQDRATGKMIIAGTFNRLFVHRRDTPADNASMPGQGPGQEPGQQPGQPPAPAPGQPFAQEPGQPPAPPAPRPAEGFHKIDPRSVSRVGSPWAYVSLTEIRGTVPLELRYVDLNDNVIMLRAEFTATSTSPLETKEMIVPLPVLPAPHPGAYALELLSHDEPLGSLRVYVTETPPSPPDQKPAEEKQ